VLHQKQRGFERLAPVARFRDESFARSRGGLAGERGTGCEPFRSAEKNETKKKPGVRDRGFFVPVFGNRGAVIPGAVVRVPHVLYKWQNPKPWYPET
jgi:hypothetical protein